jgi:hypothetical protein
MPGGLGGREVGLDGLLAAGRTALVEVRLLDGTVHRGVSSGLRPTFAVPPDRAGAEGSRWRRTTDAAVRGLADAATPAHLAFAAALALAGGAAALGGPLALFLLLAGLGALVRGTWALDAALGSAFVGIAAAVAAREALLGRSRGLSSVAAVAGLAYGLASPSASALEGLARAAGADLGHLVAAGLATAVLRGALRRWAAVGTGTVGLVAAALGAVAPPPPPAGAAPEPLLPLALEAMAAASPPAPVLGPRTTAVEVYLDVRTFETRLDLVGAVGLLAAWAGGPPPDDVGAAEENAALDRIAASIPVTISIDGTPASAEKGATALAGPGVPPGTIAATLRCATAAVPRSVVVSFGSLPPGESRVAGRVLDPETGRSVLVDAGNPRLEWTNALEEDPLPTLAALGLAPRTIEVPVLALAVLAAAAAGALALGRRARGRAAASVLRAGLAVSLLASPLWTARLAAGPRASLTDPAEARRIVATLLDQAHRALERGGDDATYDGLAQSLSGDALARVYVESRRSRARERSGASVTRVDAVELVALDDVVSRGGGGFTARATWTVSGTVTHFGHRHARRLRSRAFLEVSPADGTWKITTLEARGLDG